MRFARLAAASAASLLFASPGLAGPLAQTARGVDNKADTHSSNDSAPSPPSNPDPPPARDHDDDGCSSCSSTAVVVGGGSSYYAGTYTAVGDGEPSEPILPGPGRLDLYLGVHTVIDSDGATLGELRASKDWIGLGLSGIRYVEHVDDGKREDDVSVHLTTFTVSGRIFKHDTTELWLDGGMGITGSSEYDTLLGTAWSARAEQGIVPGLGLRGQVRYYDFEHDVSAVEGWAGVRAWFLQAGYRALKFNVGPALHGPEAGISLRF